MASYRCVVIGESIDAKISLLARHQNAIIPPKNPQTDNCDKYSLYFDTTRGVVNFMVYNRIGEYTYRGKNVFENCECVIILVEGTSRTTFGVLPTYYREIRPEAPIVVCDISPSKKHKINLTLRYSRKRLQVCKHYLKNNISFI